MFVLNNSGASMVVYIVYEKTMGNEIEKIFAEYTNAVNYVITERNWHTVPLTYQQAATYVHTHEVI